MNMALRPLSLLLLLLVVFPAIIQADLQELCWPGLQCHIQEEYFCFDLISSKEKEEVMPRDTEYHKKEGTGKEAAISQGGIALDAHRDDEWMITFSYYFDKKWDESCINRIIANGHMTVFNCKKVYDQEDLPKFGLTKGVKIVPWSQCDGWKFFQYKLQADPGLYVADELGLYLNPLIKLGIQKNLQNDYAPMLDGGQANANSEEFKAYECKINSDGNKPSPTAVKATRVDGKFVCSGDANIFLEGTNIHAQIVYCGVGGWIDADNKFILKKYQNKEHPYCMKDTIFADCGKNKCFVLDPLENPTKLIKVDDSNLLDKKLGAYVVFDSDTTWRLQLQYKDIDLTSFTIGNHKFDVSDNNVAGQPNSKVVATILMQGPKLLSGFNGKIFKLEAVQTETEKDLMKLFGFYSAGAVNKIKLEFGAKILSSDGVANYDKYVKTSGHQFGGAGAAPLNAPDINNVFKCPGDQRIYLDDSHTGAKELRFTKTEWLNVDGSPSANGFQKDANGAVIIPAVNCFTVCNDASINPTGDPKPSKTATSTATKLEYGCAGEYVKVDTKIYSTVVCENNKWTGDGQAVKLSAAYTFNAECYGVSKLIKPCSDPEKNAGCGKVVETNGVLKCDDGFALTILKSADPNKIHTSLKIEANGKWSDGATDLGDSKMEHRPVCYSKCSASNVKGDAPNDESDVALYTHVPDKNEGTLKCTAKNNLLVSTVEGAEKPYSVLTCDKDGWKEGSTEKKSFKAAKSVNELKVNGYCFKACDDERLDKACAVADKDYDCLEPTYAALKLTCPPTHVLFVNDKIADKSLVCSSQGWKKDGEANLFIDNAMGRDKKITARCFSKCGKKFLTVNAQVTLNSNTISCPGSNMISYTVDSDPAKDTLHDLTCSNDGWKGTDGTSVIPFGSGSAKKVKAECKPSCFEALVKDDCTGHGHCVKAAFKDDQWSCDVGHVLWATAESKASPNPIKCEKTSLTGSATFSIPRTTPTSQSTISCFSICDQQFFEWPTTTKVKDTTATGAYTRYCENQLHYIEFTYGAAPAITNKYMEEFKCTTNEPAASIKDHLGEKAIVKCVDRCANRFKTSCGTGLDCPSLANNKLSCDAARVMRIKNDNGLNKYVFGGIECKKDGFYENTEKVLSFSEDPDTDAKLQFDISCISHCDSGLVLKDKTDQITKATHPGRTDDILKCHPDSADTLATDQILLIDNKSKKIRVFSEATCKKDAGWQGAISKEDPSGTWTMDANGMIVKIDQNAVLGASCVKVCDSKMVKDADTSNCASNKLCERAKSDENGLKCNTNYRLFINDKNSDGITGVTTTNTMTCDNQGWKEGTAMIVDYRNPSVSITEPVQVICKNKCHPDFIFKDPTCTDCSEVIYENNALSCPDDTEILVLEHNGVTKESFSTATCSNEGWSNEKGQLFKMDDSEVGFNFRIKAKCEQICPPAGIVTDGVQKIDDSAGKKITCTDENMMLVLEETDSAGAVVTKGMYSDMVCTKDGWKRVYKPDAEPAVAFTPIVDDGTAASTAAVKAERSQRARKFSCELNDCMRPQSCDSSKENSECVNLDLSQKYKMSCETPAKIAKVGGGGGDIYYSSAQCEDGVWRSGTDVLVPALDETKKLADVSTRDAFPVACSFAACTKCKGELTEFSSTTDANVAPIEFKNGHYKTCSGYWCNGNHYLVKESSGKNKYFPDDEKKNFIKCHPTSTNADEFKTPDGTQTIPAKTVVGCVKHIPCLEHRPLKTGCDEIKKDIKCDFKAFEEKLKIGSMPSAPPIQCDGQMYIHWNSDEKSGWKILNKLQCTARGEWEAIIRLDTNITKILPETRKLNENNAEEKLMLPHIICARGDPNPDAVVPKNDEETATCSYCPFPTVLSCEGCSNPQGQATTTNNGNFKCTMTIVNGRFKFNGNEEIDKSAALVCEEINGERAWRTPDGKKVETLAVIMNEMDNISTGAIAGIIIGVILVLGLIVFGMVYVAIKKRKEIERQEKIKNKGLEQKQDSIIDAATIVDDTKTLVI